MRNHTQPDRGLWRARCIERCPPGSGSGPGKRTSRKADTPRPGPTFTNRPTALIVRYIDEHVGVRDGDGLRWGVESICDQLTELGCKIAPATYYERRARKPTAREERDEELKPRIAAVHAANYGVYGARKVWLTLNRERPAEEPPIARCTVERLMGELGLAGAVRGKVKRTTISDPKTPKPLDLVDRNFAPLAPHRLWVADFERRPRRAVRQ
jgi:putative transposase